MTLFLMSIPSVTLLINVKFSVQPKNNKKYKLML